MPRFTVDNFKPGFRFSLSDGVVTLMGVVIVTFLAESHPVIAIVIAASLGHFFLFCNVFRLPRKLELIWAALFTALAASTITFDVPGWVVTLMIAGGTAATFIFGVLRQPSYHGVGWRRINPGLLDWWLAQNSHE